jgi:hypothetical protein
MFTCSIGEEILFPPSPNRPSSPPNGLLQARCRKLENDILKLNEVRREEKLENEKKIQCFIREKEAEFHRLGTCHALKLGEIEGSYRHQFQALEEENKVLHKDHEEKSRLILTLSNEIESLHVQYEQISTAQVVNSLINNPLILTIESND